MSYLFELTCFDEKDGKLGVFEPGIISDFQINRIFYIFDVPEGGKRADHACMNSNIIFIAISGSLTLSVEIDNVQRDYILDSRTKAVYVPAGSWIIAKSFSKNAVLIGLSDKRFQDCEYQNDYIKFKNQKDK